MCKVVYILQPIHTHTHTHSHKYKMHSHTHSNALHCHRQTHTNTHNIYSLLPEKRKKQTIVKNVKTRLHLFVVHTYTPTHSGTLHTTHTHTLAVYEYDALVCKRLNKYSIFVKTN